jgi:hypothetical protein
MPISGLRLALVISVILIHSTSATYLLRFSNQTKDVLEQATNFASLKSGLAKEVPGNKFTICASIYIGYFRGYQAFYTLRQKDGRSLWFSLYIQAQDLSGDTYITVFSIFGNGLIGRASRRPHAWNQACTAVDLDSGKVLVAINGAIVYEEVITTREFLNNSPIEFQERLVLGASQWQYPGNSMESKQSEASVSGLNIFSSALTGSEVALLTSARHCRAGDLLSWPGAAWAASGAVLRLPMEDFCLQEPYPHLYLLPNHFHQSEDCLGLCPRLQPGGRVPPVPGLQEAGRLVGQFRALSRDYAKDPSKPIWLHGPFVRRPDGTFADFYSGNAAAADLWVAGQPNGGAGQPCTVWSSANPEGRLFDITCHWVVASQCLCQLHRSPVLRLRGLCKDSHIDTHYTLKYVNGSTVYKGLSGTDIMFSPTKDQLKWTLTVNLRETVAFTSAEDISYILGIHLWTIQNDSLKCDGMGRQARALKMTGCGDGAFTCRSGDCIGMEERCDQVLDCPDQSDEVGCSVVILKESYRRSAPPVLQSWQGKVRTVRPATVRVTLTLLDISAIREADNEIDIKLTAELEWTEVRANFHNLKARSENTLDHSEMDQLWVPNLIYRNNRDNDDTRSALDKSKIKILRRGNFTRSSLDVVEEIEIFEGAENPIVMLQLYTKEFKCTYRLMVFPFDTQVCCPSLR